MRIFFSVIVRPGLGLVGLFFLLSASAFAQRQHILLDEDWRFAFGHAGDAAKDFNYGIAAVFSKSGKTENTPLNPKFNDSGWRQLDLPHDWAAELPYIYSPNFDVQSHGYRPVGGAYPETSIGWYRKKLFVARRDSGQRFQLQFDGVFRNAQFWINGFYLGRNESGYVGVNYDITDYLQFEKENVITVRADATQYEGWFYEGAGIYRHVWLNQFPVSHIDPQQLFITTNQSDNAAAVRVRLKALTFPEDHFDIQLVLYDRAGKQVAANRPPVRQSPSKDADLWIDETLKLDQPRFWSLTDPYLYRLATVLKKNGKTIDSISTRIGIRDIQIKPNGVFLNGKHIKLYGTNNHQDHAGLGSALPDHLQYWRIAKLKEMGVNSYRTSHHAPTPELLDACDSLGMLVLDEQRLLNSSPEYLDQFERLIRRDRNHPSVFLWSIGNEEGWIQTTDVGRRIAQTLLAKQQDLDPTRTSTYAADVGDVFQGVNEVIPVRGFNYRHQHVDAYHEHHPNQPIIGTEMGSTVTTRGIYEKDTVRAYVPDQDITFPWWASTAEAWWTLAANKPHWLGGFIWTGFDYRGEPTPYQWPNVSSHFGVMDLCGFPKNIYYYYKSWWTKEDVLHISTHWNLPVRQAGWKGKEGKAIDVWVNSNADAVELFLNGKSLGRKAMPRNSHLQWQVAYQPGKLEAVGYYGKRSIRTQQVTTGAPVKIVAKASKSTLMADGRDAVVVDLSVVDKNGYEVPDAQHRIGLSLTGTDLILGVGNGDPSNHDREVYRSQKAEVRLFNGKAQAILQSGRDRSALLLQVTADGLQSATVRLPKQ